MFRGRPENSSLGRFPHLLVAGHGEQRQRPSQMRQAAASVRGRWLHWRGRRALGVFGEPLGQGREADGCTQLAAMPASLAASLDRAAPAVPQTPVVAAVASVASSPVQRQLLSTELRRLQVPYASGVDLVSRSPYRAAQPAVR